MIGFSSRKSVSLFIAFKDRSNLSYSTSAKAEQKSFCCSCSTFKADNNKGKPVQAMLLELYHKLVPPSDTGAKAISTYLSSLCGETKISDSLSLGPGSRPHVLQIRNIVNCVALLGEKMTLPSKDEVKSAVNHDYVPYQTSVQAGDFGILGAQGFKENVFDCLGNIIDDSSGFFSISTTSVFWKYMPVMKKVSLMWENPFTWEIDFNSARNDGFETIATEWGCCVSLNITPYAASQFLEYSTPFLADCHENWKDTVLVTKVDYYELYEFNICGAQADATGTTAIQSLPTIYAIQRHVGKATELVFSKSQIDLHTKPTVLDDYIQFKKKRIVKAIDYVRINMDQCVKKVTRMESQQESALRGTQYSSISCRRHVGSDRPLFMQEYEALPFSSSSKHEMTPVSKEI
ncbi:uncharacterized protein FOMMEDRAFT_27522 [Fomitiporia mediterranea MF3/22]|uniref:uncharacterized protein n=1 Tax=Fomitiporia mediterranea (strain MF3/22) TaxID=694068 RepID=UPI00044088E3|nr:uncharacterized protein FOMMEDRAFT_27522 [Fomitiporia mediterranea MF3/22]EJD03570.1 hypothetical protein FOMMEDRAFT_27522 [Fomitiporia mediterranea MF3/22]